MTRRFSTFCTPFTLSSCSCSIRPPVGQHCGCRHCFMTARKALNLTQPETSEIGPFFRQRDFKWLHGVHRALKLRTAGHRVFGCIDMWQVQLPFEKGATWSRLEGPQPIEQGAAFLPLGLQQPILYLIRSKEHTETTTFNEIKYAMRAWNLKFIPQIASEWSRFGFWTERSCDETYCCIDMEFALARKICARVLLLSCARCCSSLIEAWNGKQIFWVRAAVGCFLECIYPHFWKFRETLRNMQTLANNICRTRK